MAVEVKSIRYNAATSAFEGRVDVRKNGTSYRYPCSVMAPMNTPANEVRRRMVHQAQSMSDTPAALFSHL